jgi:hemolysin-activating ACP:hemolysin acyltransferase
MFFRSKKESAKDGKEPLPSPAPAMPSEVAGAPPAEAAEPTTPASAAAPATDGAKPLAPDELKKRAEVSQRLAAAVGEIVGLMMRSPRHRDHKLADLRWLILPAVRTGQYAMVQTQSKSNGFTAPVAAVLWARVSAEIDKRLSEKLDEPLRLGPREWRSGDTLWLIETIGDDRAVAALVHRLRDGEWKGRSVKARVSDASGQVKVRLIEPQAASNGAAARSE